MWGGKKNALVAHISQSPPKAQSQTFPLSISLWLLSSSNKINYRLHCLTSHHLCSVAMLISSSSLAFSAATSNKLRVEHHLYKSWSWLCSSSSATVVNTKSWVSASLFVIWYPPFYDYVIYALLCFDFNIYAMLCFHSIIMYLILNYFLLLMQKYV